MCSEEEAQGSQEQVAGVLTWTWGQRKLKEAPGWEHLFFVPSALFVE